MRSEAARSMGRARSDAKKAAVRRNGGLGGRPRGYRLSEESRRKISETKRRSGNDPNDMPDAEATGKPLSEPETDGGARI